MKGGLSNINGDCMWVGTGIPEYLFSFLLPAMTKSGFSGMVLEMIRLSELTAVAGF